MSWEDEALSGFLKVVEGEHSLKVYGEPSPQESKFVGKDGKAKVQQVFDVELDGVRGKMAPPRKLLKLLASMRKANVPYPLTIKFRRVGMGMESKFEVVV